MKIGKKNRRLARAVLAYCKELTDLSKDFSLETLARLREEMKRLAKEEV